MGTRYTSNLATDLGRISYDSCLDLQMRLAELRKAGIIGDTVLFLEHDPPVYTIGRKSDPSNWPGIDPVRTDRGGDVTYHSPGQLVFYPIFNLLENGKVDVRAFVRRIEKSVMDALLENGVETYVGEEPGIWTKDGDRKVASLGMAIQGNVSHHGVAVNISPEPLEGFARINPCGLDPKVMGYVPIGRSRLIGSLLKSLSETFAPFEMVGKDDIMSLAYEALKQTAEEGSD